MPGRVANPGRPMRRRPARWIARSAATASAACTRAANPRHAAWMSTATDACGASPFLATAARADGAGGGSAFLVATATRGDGGAGFARGRGGGGAAAAAAACARAAAASLPRGWAAADASATHRRVVAAAGAGDRGLAAVGDHGRM